MREIIGGVFVVIALLMIPTALIGLVSPAKLANGGKPPPTRKSILWSCTAGLVLFTLIGGAILPGKPSEQSSPETTQSTPPQAPADSPSSDQAPVLASQVNSQPAAKPASPKEWAQIQSLTNSLWAASMKQSRAHDQLTRSLRVAAENFDIEGTAKALFRYQFALEDSKKAIAAISAPEVANDDTARFIDDAFSGLETGTRLELEKNEALIQGMRGNQQPSDDWLAHQNRLVNEQTVRFVMALHRIYFNYGYESTDIDDQTFKVKKGAVPKAIVDFNRG